MLVVLWFINCRTDTHSGYICKVEPIPQKKEISYLWSIANQDTLIDSIKINYFKKIDSLASLNPELFADYLVGSHAKISNLHAEDYKSWEHYLSKAERYLNLYDPILSDDLILHTRVLTIFERGRFHDSRGEEEQAIDYYKIAYEEIPKGCADPELINFKNAMLYSVAQIQFSLGNYEEALDWLKVNEKYLNIGHVDYPGLFHNLQGNIYVVKNELINARINFLKAKYYFEKTEVGVSKNHYIDNFIDMAMTYLPHQIDSALYFLNEAKSKEGLKVNSQLNVHFHLSNIYSDLNKTDSVFRYAKTALVYADSLEKGSYFWKGRILNILAKELNKKGEWKGALDSLQAAFSHLTHGFRNSDWKVNPNPEESFSKLDLLKVFITKTKILEECAPLFKKGEKEYYYGIALNTYQTIIQLIKILRRNYQDDDVKEYLADKVFPTIENAVDLSFKLYQITNDSNFIDKAFYFTENGKALSLLENLKELELKDKLNIPIGLREKEEMLKRQIATLEKEAEQGGNVENHEILIEAKNNYDELKNEYKKINSKYFYSKYKERVASIKDVQNYLQPNETLIEYFYGEKNIYVFTISKTDFNVHQIQVTNSMEKDIDSFALMISKRSKLVNDTLGFKTIGNGLYEKLIRQLNIKTDKITIIPDGPLHQLSFAALPTHGTLSDDPKRWPYLIQKYIIDYHFSASVMLQQEKKEWDKEMTNSLLVIAPIEFPPGLNSLEMDEVHLSVLKDNGVRVDVLERPNRERVLKALGEGYQYVFFFTHGESPDKREPFIYLRNGSLFLSDIYTHKIKTQSVFLTACVTGRGKNKRGEGVMSLARGFAYQNVPNAVMTLWSPEEKASRDISLGFLQYHIVDKKSPAEALRQAQLDFLGTGNSNYGFPYEWAGIVVVGK